MTPEEFLSWLINNKPVTIIFEACSSSNYWKQKATDAGHDARLISAKLVSVVRQNQKTDKNDALAIVQTTFMPDITYIGGKTVEQQQLQSIKRLRELAVKQPDASQKQLIALLFELNIKISSRKGCPHRPFMSMDTSSRKYQCLRCHALVIICHRCDHGQRYCTHGCSEQARKESTQRASKSIKRLAKVALIMPLANSDFAANQNKK
jgi:hypothetical protein